MESKNENSSIVGQAVFVDNKFGKPSFEVTLFPEKFSELNPDKNYSVNLSLKNDLNNGIVVYQDTFKTRGIVDDQKFLDINVQYDKLNSSYQTETKLSILVLPKNPEIKSANDFSGSDYNLFSYQNSGHFMQVGKGFTQEPNIEKGKEHGAIPEKSNDRHNYVFVGNATAKGEITLNDSTLQKNVDKSSEYTSLNLVKADNADKYFVYLSKNAPHEVFDYKFSMNTLQLLNLPVKREDEISLQAFHMNPQTNRQLSDIGITTSSNYEHAEHLYYIKNLPEVEIKKYEILSYGHSKSQFFEQLKTNLTEDNKIGVKHNEIQKLNSTHDKTLPLVKVGLDDLKSVQNAASNLRIPKFEEIVPGKPSMGI